MYSVRGKAGTKLRKLLEVRDVCVSYNDYIWTNVLFTILCVLSCMTLELVAK